MKPRREIDPVIARYMCDVDRTLLRENLKLTHEQRLQKLLNFLKFAAALRDAGNSSKRNKRKQLVNASHGS